MIKDKYIIFFREKFLIPSTNCFSCIKSTFNIVHELENSGITVININDIKQVEAQNNNSSICPNNNV